MIARPLLADDLSVTAPVSVPHAVMLQRWEDLTFVDAAVDPDPVRRCLPANLEVDTIGGAAWLSIVAFHLSIRTPRVPGVPWASRFPEINLRTYVRGPDGRRGIWFFSLDAARLGAVVAARLWYRLPYVWGRLAIESAGPRTSYQSRRRWPGPRGAGLSLEVEHTGSAIRSPDELDRFLTCRWRLYSPVSGRLAATQVEHTPWPLFPARILDLREDLVAAAGLGGARPRWTRARWSPGVSVRFAARERLIA